MPTKTEAGYLWKEERTALVGRLLLVEEIPVRAYLMSVLRDAEAADDVFQQVAVVAMEKAGDFVPGSNFRAWIFSIARLSCLEYRRKRPGIKVVSPEIMDLLAAEAAEEDVPEHLVSAFFECLDRLPAEGRKALFQRYVERVPVGKIAAGLKRTLQGTYALIKRLKGKLRECVERKTGFHPMKTREAEA